MRLKWQTKGNKLVIQGSHMVSGTLSPAWRILLEEWSESRAAAPKSWCPVAHRGEFPDVLRGHIWGLRSNFPWYSMGVLNFVNFLLICHVIQWEFHIFLIFLQFSMLFNGKFASYQFSMLFNGYLRLEKHWGGERMEEWTSGNSPLCPTGHWPFGAAAQKGYHHESTYN